jgi:hypothetical protein
VPPLCMLWRGGWQVPGTAQMRLIWACWACRSGMAGCRSAHAGGGVDRPRSSGVRTPRLKRPGRAVQDIGVWLSEMTFGRADGSCAVRPGVARNAGAARLGRSAAGASPRLGRGGWKRHRRGRRSRSRTVTLMAMRDRLRLARSAGRRFCSSSASRSSAPVSRYSLTNIGCMMSSSKSAGGPLLPRRWPGTCGRSHQRVARTTDAAVQVPAVVTTR